MIYIRKVINEKPRDERTEYPHNIPAIHNLDELEFNSNVTFIIGENGSGKSTLIEAMAVCLGLNPEGGSSNLNYRTLDTHSDLFNDLKIVRGPYRNRDGFFLRAESFYNVAGELDRISSPTELARNYGGPLHERSHGESFLGVIMNRLSGRGLYIFDEPESALSIPSQFKFLVKIRQLEKLGSQFVIATHSPILLAYPDAEIYTVTENGMELTEYEETDQYRLTKYFISNHEDFLKELFDE